MTRYAAAIDQGITGTRFMVFDRTGQVVASTYEEHTQITPRPGWVEHDAGEIWAKTQRAWSGGPGDRVWTGLDELRANWGVDRVFEPRWDETRREEVYAEWKRAVARSRGWVQGA